MMTKKKLFVMALLLAVSSTSASAQDTSISLGISTFGPTLEASYKIQQKINIRGIGFIPLKSSVSDIEVEDHYTLDGEFDTGAAAILTDFYPMGQGWRISGGLFFPPNSLVTGKFTGPETFTGSLNMERSVAPMLAGGYQYNFNNGWIVGGEIGAIFSGFKATTDSVNPIVIAEIAKINADLDDLPAYPYIAVSFGVSY